MKKLGLYIHIPFCERKCNYCDFYSLVKTGDIEEKYISALIKEIISYKDRCLNYEVDSIFIGGGTPSHIKPENVGLIIGEIKKNFIVSNNVEITMEANPNSITREKVLKYKSYDINRMSVGIQSLDNKVLKTIGRLHNSDEAINALKIIKGAGINNINADVMFNIPGQSVEGVINTLNLIIAENIEHISFYSLKLEENTPMFEMEKKGLIQMVDEDIERGMYYAGRKFMENNGYLQYEISNFAKKGFECKHNIKYWSGGDYIGFGPFSHSCFEDKRYNNISNLKIYCDYIDEPSNYRQLNEILNKKSKMFEYIMLGLRMNSGINTDDFNAKFEENFMNLYSNQLKKLNDYELIVINKNVVKLTKKGMDLSNCVFEEFL